MTALVMLGSIGAKAESGDQEIEGTWVHTVIDHERGVAIFSNECGSQTLTQGQLQAGAIPSDIIPCPRPRTGPSAECRQVKAQFQEAMSKPMSVGWRRALLCIPGLRCEATCADFDEYEQALDEKRDLERKWVLQCNGTLKLDSGETIDRDGLDAHHEFLYRDLRERKKQVCEAEAAALEQQQQAQAQQQAAAAMNMKKEKRAACEADLSLAKTLVPRPPSPDTPLANAAYARLLPELTSLRKSARDDCSGLTEEAAAYKNVDATLGQAIAAAQATNVVAPGMANSAAKAAVSGASSSGTNSGNQGAGGAARAPAVVATAPAMATPSTSTASKAANPKFPLSAKAASALPPSQRWIATGSAADCAKAGALERNTAGWYDMCVSDPETSGAAVTPARKKLKPLPAAARTPADTIPEALATLLQSLPQDTPASGDDGHACGRWDGHRSRGKCFAPWFGNTPSACQTDLGGTYYPATADNPTSFCAYDEPASDAPAEGEPCGDAGGHIHGGACWILSVTHDDCDDLHGKIVESDGYQYCAYNPAAGAQTAASTPTPAPDNLRDRLRKSLSAGGGASADNADDTTQTTPPAPAPAAPKPTPQQTALKTMTPAQERKACAAMGSKWRYDPTATYNFSPGAPPKCFPVFTESLEGEPGFEKQQ